MNSLVGYTGFVGSNINLSTEFTKIYNSKNIVDAYGTNPDLLVYAGVKAEKFLSNKDPEADYKNIKQAFLNIKKINPQKVVLISTVDVYEMPDNVNEDAAVNFDKLQAYGLNRYYLEQWVEDEYANALIVRLPGLYGENIKKNFIFDLINIIPNMLNEKKFLELCKIDSFIKRYYTLQENNFYKCIELKNEERTLLKEYFNKVGFSALNFTDSRGSYQFYNLKYLWKHIKIALECNISKLNLATEPVTVREIYNVIKNQEFINEILSCDIPRYNMKTKYAESFGGTNGYLWNKEIVLQDIKKFVEGYII